MRAIGYFQIADEGPGSVPELERAFEDYCRLNLHQAVRTFASTGRDGPPQDDGYQRMVGYLQGSVGEYLVVVPDASHLGTDLESVATALVELERAGAEVVCSDQDFPDPVQNAFQVLGVKGVSRTRSQSIKESMRARAIQGQALGKTPFGYGIGANGTLEVVRAEAAVVELIYRLFTKDSLGLRLIAQHLNERGITTRRGGNWNVVSLRDILRNPVYTGTYTRLGLRRPKVHEAIIPPDVFRSAQELTRERRPVGRVASSEPFLLSGVLLCGYCGNKMLGVTRRQSWKRKDGRRARNVYRYYQCQSRNNQSRCGYHTWRTSLLEGTVLSQLGHALEARSAREGQDGAAHSARRERIQAVRGEKVRNAEDRLVRAMKRAARGEVSITLLGEYLKELRDARDSAASADSPRSVSDTLADWESLDMEARRAFISEHVVRIDVEDDKVNVVV